MTVCINVWINVCIDVCMCVHECMHEGIYICMYGCMTTTMYCLYVEFDYTYINIKTLAQGIKYFLASQVWFQAVAEART